MERATPPPGRTIAHTDGSCREGLGGWGVVLRTIGPEGETIGNPVRFSGRVSPATNNRMEVQAAIEALRACPAGPIEIVSDSRYLIKGAREWLAGWVARNWRNAAGRRAANPDLWRMVWELSAGRDVRWTWIKGHAGDAHNEAADALASAAASRVRTC